MYYNQQFPNYGYYPQAQQQPQQPQQMQQAQDERIWVTSQSSAEAYLVASNGFVRLWDSSCNRFYEKSADYSGRPYPMKVYEYKEVTGQETPSVNYVSQDEFTEFKDKVDQFISAFEKE